MRLYTNEQFLHSLDVLEIMENISLKDIDLDEFYDMRLNILSQVMKKRCTYIKRK